MSVYPTGVPWNILIYAIGYLLILSRKWGINIQTKPREATMIDKNEFFREATLRICGNLEIEKALWATFAYIRDFIPMERILINIYWHDLKTATAIAKADISGGQAISTMVPPCAHRMLEDLRRNPDKAPLVWRADRIDNHPITSSLFPIYGNQDAAVMSLHPRIDGKTFGNVIVCNKLGEEYSDRHVELFSLLNEPFAIALSNYVRYKEVTRLRDMLADDNRYLQEELWQHVGEEIVGANFGLKHVMDLVHQVAHLSNTVLLLGETGTGKEVIATAIHNFSPRKGGPFIKVNCGAIPETLLDSELFGHEKGAFTGALAQKRGRFERAHKGTIFLDEIGELTSGAQVRLLRVLQEKTIERVGGTEAVEVDVRVIAATHRDLDAMLAEGTFREDLYFRLKVFPIIIPPLRDRLGDIPTLVQHFMQSKAREIGLQQIPTIIPEAIARLLNYKWPGNVRELQNAVERALIISNGAPLTFDEFGEIAERRVIPHRLVVNEDTIAPLDQVLFRHITRALEATHGQVGGKNGAAKLLRMHPSTLRKKMRKLSIPFGRKTHLQKGQ